MKGIFALLVALAMMLTSCTSWRKDMRLYSNDTEVSDRRMQEILEALKSEDIGPLKDMFGKGVLDETENFEDSCQTLLSFFQGEVKKWERIRYSSTGHSGKDVNWYKIYSWYRVETDKEKYLFFMVDYTKNTVEPQFIGLYTLRVIHEEDEDTQFTYMEDMELPGICCPGIKNEEI